MNKPKTFAIALLITAAVTLPLKAAEQCCQPCPNGVLVGVTADSCGTCMDLAKFIPGCITADTSGCTTCKTGFTLSDGTCIASGAGFSGRTCKVIKSRSGQHVTTEWRFIPGCFTCHAFGLSLLALETNISLDWIANNDGGLSSAGCAVCHEPVSPVVSQTFTGSPWGPQKNYACP